MPDARALHEPLASEGIGPRRRTRGGDSCRRFSDH